MLTNGRDANIAAEAIAARLRKTRELKEKADDRMNRWIENGTSLKGLTSVREDLAELKGEENAYLRIANDLGVRPGVDQRMKETVHAS